MPLLLIKSLDITLPSDRFFSRLGKDLVFVSLFSTMFAFDLRINPFNLMSVIFSSSSFFSRKLLLIISILSVLFVSDSVLLNIRISSLNVDSCLLVSFFFLNAYLIVSVLTVPFISSQRVFGFDSLFIKTGSFKFFFIISWYSAS